MKPKKTYSPKANKFTTNQKNLAKPLGSPAKQLVTLCHLPENYFLSVNSSLNEPGFGDDRVGGEDPHPVQGSLGLVLGRQLPANDTEFPQWSLRLHLLTFIYAPHSTKVQPEKDERNVNNANFHRFLRAQREQHGKFTGFYAF